MRFCTGMVDVEWNRLRTCGRSVDASSLLAGPLDFWVGNYTRCFAAATVAPFFSRRRHDHMLPPCSSPPLGHPVLDLDAAAGDVVI